MSETCAVGTFEPVAGACSVGTGGGGILGVAVPSTGTNGPSYLYHTLSLPADNLREFRAIVEAYPAAGTLLPQPDTSFIYTAPPGTMDQFTVGLWQDYVKLGTYVVELWVGVSGTLNFAVGGPMGAWVGAVSGQPVIGGNLQFNIGSPFGQWVGAMQGGAAISASLGLSVGGPMGAFVGRLSQDFSGNYSAPRSTVVIRPGTRRIGALLTGTPSQD